jgi:hypothetical protein
MLHAPARAVCCVTALFWSLATAAVAAPITYFFSETGSGNIGSATFTNAPYVIALSGDTSAIDYTWEPLAVWRNVVIGTIQVKGLRKATLTEPVAIATSCGAGFGVVGIEPVPSTFLAYIFKTQGIPDADCVLGPAALIMGLTATVNALSNVPTTRGPITLTSSSSITYQAQTCSALKVRACRKQSVKFGRALLNIRGD